MGWPAPEVQSGNGFQVMRGGSVWKREVPFNNALRFGSKDIFKVKPLI